MILADKYNIDLARTRLRPPFREFATTKPLKAYAIACQLGLEEEKKIALSYKTSIHLCARQYPRDRIPSPHSSPLEVSKRDCGYFLPHRGDNPYHREILRWDSRWPGRAGRGEGEAGYGELSRGPQSHSRRSIAGLRISHPGVKNRIWDFRKRPRHSISHLFSSQLSQYFESDCLMQLPYVLLIRSPNDLFFVCNNLLLFRVCGFALTPSCDITQL